MKMTRKKLAEQFESLGVNCEFGLVQSRCGAEPLGLLRFSTTPLPLLINALDARFEGMGSPDAITVQTSRDGREYVIIDHAFGFVYHAWVSVDKQTPEAIHRREVRRVPFLVRKLIEDLTNAEKIFVYHGLSPLAVDDVLRLHQSMQEYGPNVLMWVEVEDEESPAGSVEWIVPGLLKAHVDRFAPEQAAHDLSLKGWMAVCRKAYAMSRARSSHGQPTVVGSRGPRKFVGFLDDATRSGVVGWVANQADWSQSLCVEILVDGVIAATCEANLYRDGLEKIHPHATGRYEFKYDFEEPLSDSSVPKIEVRVAHTGYYLQASS